VTESSPISPESPRPRLSLVAPTYNEAGRLAELVAAVFAVFKAHSIDGELVIVDDNSPDGTGALADELATRYRMKVVHRSGKLGLGTACRRVRCCDRRDLGVIDATCYPPALMPRMLAAIERGDADFVTAAGHIPGGGRRTGLPAVDVAGRLPAVAAGDASGDATRVLPDRGDAEGADRGWRVQDGPSYRCGWRRALPSATSSPAARSATAR
jgi:glycosyltransferase involved in cell wall biosynthesis